VTLNWPTKNDYDALTALRNRPGTRKWFLDDREVSVEESRRWLRDMPRPRDALLVIRESSSETFLGSIGWTNWDTSAGTATFGRLAIERSGLRRLAAKLGAPVSIAVDAATALRDFAFCEMGLVALDTWYAADNTLAAKVNASVGMVVTGPDSLVRPGGQLLPITRATLTRARWIGHSTSACRT